MATAAISPFEPSSVLESAGLFEVVNGLRREVLPMGAWAGAVASLLVHHMSNFATEHRLGVVLVEVLFRLARNNRRPDVAFVAFDRWPLPRVPTEDPPALDVAPNLAVEVVSPNNSAAEIFGKIREYFEARVQLVWVIYPLQRCVPVFDSETHSRILGEEEELDGGSVLPGFRLSVSELFATAAQPR
jgi:Uma2 family endonuclease